MLICTARRLPVASRRCLFQGASSGIRGGEDLTRLLARRKMTRELRPVFDRDRSLALADAIALRRNPPSSLSPPPPLPPIL